MRRKYSSIIPASKTSLYRAALTDGGEQDTCERKQSVGHDYCHHLLGAYARWLCGHADMTHPTHTFLPRLCCQGSLWNTMKMCVKKKKNPWAKLRLFLLGEEKQGMIIQSSMFKECTVTRECKEDWMLRNLLIFCIKRLRENNHLVICISFEKIKMKGYLMLPEAFAFSLLPIPENQITTQIIKLLSLTSSSHICT